MTPRVCRIACRLIWGGRGGLASLHLSCVCVHAIDRQRSVFGNSGTGGLRICGCMRAATRYLRGVEQQLFVFRPPAWPSGQTSCWLRLKCGHCYKSQTYCGCHVSVVVLWLPRSPECTANTHAILGAIIFSRIMYAKKNPLKTRETSCRKISTCVCISQSQLCSKRIISLLEVATVSK